jgi:hypothetical protein
MAAGDAVRRTVAEQALLATLHDCDVIFYRQQALDDAIKHPDTVRALYGYGPIWALLGQEG